VNPFIIDFEELRLGRMIRQGPCSEVFEGKWLELPVTVKVLLPCKDVKPDGTEPLERRRKQLAEAVAGLNRLRHPNILLFLGATLSHGRPLCIVSEHIEGYHLEEYIKGAGDLPLEKKFKIALAVARGMFYLHSASPPVLHQDLKLENVFLSRDGSRIVISDFGLGGRSKLLWTSQAHHNPIAISYGNGSRWTVYICGRRLLLWSTIARNILPCERLCRLRHAAVLFSSRFNFTEYGPGNSRPSQISY